MKRSRARESTVPAGSDALDFLAKCFAMLRSRRRNACISTDGNILEVIHNSAYLRVVAESGCPERPYSVFFYVSAAHRERPKQAWYNRSLDQLAADKTRCNAREVLKHVVEMWRPKGLPPELHALVAHGTGERVAA